MNSSGTLIVDFIQETAKKLEQKFSMITPVEILELASKKAGFDSYYEACKCNAEEWKEIYKNRVLLVCSDQSAQLLSRIMECHDINFICETNAKAAFNAIKKEKFEVVMAESGNVSEGFGHEILSRTKSIHPDSSLIGMTADKKGGEFDILEQMKVDLIIFMPTSGNLFLKSIIYGYEIAENCKQDNSGSIETTTANNIRDIDLSGSYRALYEYHCEFFKYIQRAHREL